MMENMVRVSPLAKMPGFEAMQAQQEAFIKAMTGGKWPAGTQPAPAEEGKDEDLTEIRRQLADLQNKLSRMGK